MGRGKKNGMDSTHVLEAEIFDNCALRPTCLSPAAVSEGSYMLASPIRIHIRGRRGSCSLITTTGACMMGGSVLSGDNRWKKGEFHG